MNIFGLRTFGYGHFWCVIFLYCCCHLNNIITWKRDDCVRKQQRQKKSVASEDKMLDWSNAYIGRHEQPDCVHGGKRRGSSEGQGEGFGSVGHEMGQRAVRGEKKKRGGTTRAATAFRHVTFLFTSGCNTHSPCYWLSPAPFHAHITSEGLWPAFVHTKHKQNEHKVFKNLQIQLFQLHFSVLVFLNGCGGDTGLVADGSQSYLGDAAPTPVLSHPQTTETRSQYLQAYTHALTHREEQEVQWRLNLKMCVVRLEACTSLWREGEAGGEGGHGGRGVRRWETGGRANGHRQTVSARGSALAGGGVRHKSCNTSAAKWESGQQQQQRAGRSPTNRPWVRHFGSLI